MIRVRREMVYNIEVPDASSQDEMLQRLNHLKQVGWNEGISSQDAFMTNVWPMVLDEVEDYWTFFPAPGTPEQVEDYFKCSGDLDPERFGILNRCDKTAEVPIFTVPGQPPDWFCYQCAQLVKEVNAIQS